MNDEPKPELKDTVSRPFILSIFVEIPTFGPGHLGIGIKIAYNRLFADAAHFFRRFQ